MRVWTMVSLSVGAGLLGVLGAERVVHAAPAVWVIDDGEKIKRDATSLPFASGTSNPVWSPSQPAHLFALRNETVALQVVVQADATALAGVTVDLPSLRDRGARRSRTRQEPRIRRATSGGRSSGSSSTTST